MEHTRSRRSGHFSGTGAYDRSPQPHRHRSRSPHRRVAAHGGMRHHSPPAVRLEKATVFDKQVWKFNLTASGSSSQQQRKAVQILTQVRADPRRFDNIKELIWAMDIFHQHDHYQEEARELCSLFDQVKKYQGDTINVFEQYELEGRIRANQAIQRVGGAKYYFNMSREEQVDFVLYYLIPRKEYSRGFKQLEQLNLDYIAGRFEFSDSASHVDMKEAMRICLTQTEHKGVANVDEHPALSMQEIHAAERSATSWSDWHNLYQRVAYYQAPNSRYFSYKEKHYLDKALCNALKNLYLLDTSTNREKWLEQLLSKGDALFVKRYLYPKGTPGTSRLNCLWRYNLYDVRIIVDSLIELEEYAHAQRILSRMSRSCPSVALDIRKKTIREETRYALVLAYVLTSISSTRTKVTALSRALHPQIFRQVVPGIQVQAEPMPIEYLGVTCSPPQFHSNVALALASRVLRKINEFDAAMNADLGCIEWFTGGISRDYEKRESDYQRVLCSALVNCCQALALSTDAGVISKARSNLVRCRKLLGDRLQLLPHSLDEHAFRHVKTSLSEAYCMSLVADRKQAQGSWQDISDEFETRDLIVVSQHDPRYAQAFQYDLKLQAFMEKIQQLQRALQGSSGAYSSLIKKELEQLHSQMTAVCSKIERMKTAAIQDGNHHGVCCFIYTRICELFQKSYALQGKMEKSETWRGHYLAERNHLMKVWPALAELPWGQLFPCVTPLNTWYKYQA